MRLVAFAMGSLLVASPLDAQRIPPRTGGIPQSNPNAGAIRLVSSVGIAGLGIIAGGFLGYHLIPHCTGCEDPGLDAIVYGSFIGSAIGAAFGAARPDLYSVCPFRRRFQRTLLGASAGAAAMFILGGGLSKNESSLILVPAGSVGGALASLGRCWKMIQ